MVRRTSPVFPKPSSELKVIIIKKIPRFPPKQLRVGRCIALYSTASAAKRPKLPCSFT